MPRTKKQPDETTQGMPNNPVEKPAAKKTAKAPTAKTAPKLPALKRAPAGSEFHLADGRNIADLKQLADILDEMSAAVWSHHVNSDRNDFANWIRDVIEEPELSQRIREASSSHHAQVVIYRTILERT